MSHVHGAGPLLCILLLLAGCAHSATPAAAEQAALHESLCWLMADPGAYDGKLVRVRARIISDGLEYVQLVDESCRGSAIDVQVREPHASDPEISNLIKLAYARGMRDSSKPIAATFTGVLKHQPAGFPPIILNVIGVADVVSEPEP